MRHITVQRDDPADPFILLSLRVTDICCIRSASLLLFHRIISASSVLIFSIPSNMISALMSALISVA